MYVEQTMIALGLLVIVGALLILWLRRIDHRPAPRDYDDPARFSDRLVTPDMLGEKPPNRWYSNYGYIEDVGGVISFHATSDDCPWPEQAKRPGDPGYSEWYQLIHGRPYG